MSVERSTIWKRRAALMAVIALAVAVPVTLLAKEVDEPPPPEPVVAETPKLGSAKLHRDLGVKLRLPKGWDSKSRGEVLLLKSGDGQARVALSAPGPAQDADQLHDEVLSEFRRTYDNFDVSSRDGRGRVGGLKARTTAIRAEAKKAEQELGILVSTAEGKKRAYLVVVFTPAMNPGPSTVEAQTLLNKLTIVG